jgi:hypothetical protein
LLGAERLEQLARDLAGDTVLHLGHSIGDRGGVGVSRGSHQSAFQMYAIAAQWVPAWAQCRDNASLREQKWSVNSKT